MTVTVYIDELVLQNCIISLLILMGVGRLTRAYSGFFRYFAVSLASGIISAAMFFVEVSTPVSFAVKLAVSFTTVLSAYRYEGRKRFIKRILWFYAASLVCAGMVYIIQSAMNTDRLGVVNLVVYADLSPTVVLAAAAVCYAVAYIVSVVRPETDTRSIVYPLELSAGGRTIVTSALVDTGNSISDLYSGHQVIICSEKECKRLFGGVDFEQRRGYRILPCSTVTGKGFMPACLAESAVIHCGGEPIVIMSPLIAAAGDLGSAEFGALLPADILKEIGYEKTEERTRNINNSKRS